MKLLDQVKVVCKNNKYAKNNIYNGMIGTIIEADIRWNQFYVCFSDQRIYDKNFNKQDVFDLKDDICLGIDIQDLELFKNNNCSDKLIYDSLPENHKDFWCKVEDGYIINLLGQKKNTVAYKYNGN